MHCLPYWDCSYNPREVLGFFNLFFIELKDHIALLNPCFFRGPTLKNLGYKCPLLVLEVKGPGKLRSYFLDTYTYPAAGYFPFFLELRHDLFSHVCRDCKPYSLSGSDNCRVNSDHFSFRVDQWSTAIPRVNRCICLDEVVIWTCTDGSSL